MTRPGTEDFMDDEEFLDDDDDGAGVTKSAAAQSEAAEQALREAVLVVLHELVDKELVEIDEPAFDVVAGELVLAVQEARDPKHAIKKLRAALIDSASVEEVYANDRRLEAAFRRALGG